MNLFSVLNRCYLPVVYHHNYSPNRPPPPQSPFHTLCYFIGVGVRGINHSHVRIEHLFHNDCVGAATRF